MEEASSNTETVTPGLSRGSANPGPLILDPVEKLHRETDSFLTAARLVRGGWAGEKTGWQVSPLTSSGRGFVRSNGAEALSKGSWTRRVPAASCRKTAEDGETNCDTKTKEAKQKAEGALAAFRRGLCSQTGDVRVWAGRHHTCRRFTSFKAPLLPVIAEV